MLSNVKFGFAEATENSPLGYHYQFSAISIGIEDTLAYLTNVNAGSNVDLKAIYAILGVPLYSKIDLIENREITHAGQIVGNPEFAVSRSARAYTTTCRCLCPLVQNREHIRSGRLFRLRI